jgi:hypothetical protein
MPGYADFLEAITGPTREEHDHFLEWCGSAASIPLPSILCLPISGSQR